MRVLLTSFEAYGEWDENASWLTMKELLQESPTDMQLMTRRYPVDLAIMRECLKKDLDHRFDAILHLGQAPGAYALQLETVALNANGCLDETGEELPPLEPAGPVAYRSRLPIGRWAELLRENNVPVLVSHHAGTYLCNALMYLSHFHYGKDPSAPFIGFIHVPLATEQVADQMNPNASLPTALMAEAIQLVLRDLIDWHRSLPNAETSRVKKPKQIAQEA